jgi:(2Fe-2S) ferredoxin
MSEDPRASEARIQYHFFVCTNRRPENHPLPSCAAAGSDDVYQAFLADLRRRGYPCGIKVTATFCLTPCQHGPNVVVYPAGLWYCGVKPEDVAKIIAAHVDDNASIPALYLPPNVPL